MNEYYVISYDNSMSGSIKITDETCFKVIAPPDSPEQRCLKKMMRNRTAIIVDKGHPWYDFVYVVFEYIADRTEI